MVTRWKGGGGEGWKGEEIRKYKSSVIETVMENIVNNIVTTVYGAMRIRTYWGDHFIKYINVYVVHPKLIQSCMSTVIEN